VYLLAVSKRAYWLFIRLKMATARGGASSLSLFSSTHQESRELLQFFWRNISRIGRHVGTAVYDSAHKLIVSQAVANIR
jgi:hypothetical protein